MFLFEAVNERIKYEICETLIYLDLNYFDRNIHCSMPPVKLFMKLSEFRNLVLLSFKDNLGWEESPGLCLFSFATEIYIICVTVNCPFLLQRNSLHQISVLLGPVVQVTLTLPYQ